MSMANLDVSSPEAVDAFREEIESHYLDVMWGPMTQFLSYVVDAALASLAAPAVLTAAAPQQTLAWTTVRNRWYDTIRSIARLEPSLSDRSVMGLLENAMLPSDAYADVQAIMRQSIEEGWSEFKTKRALSARLIPQRGDDESARAYASRVRAAARTAATANVNRWVEAEVARTGGAYKRWVTMHDDRVREGHSAADGQEVPLGSPFVVDGEYLQYPGDPHGSPENVVNCRCIVVGSDGPFHAGSYAPRRTLDDEADLDDLPDDLDDLFDVGPWAARRARRSRRALRLRSRPSQ